MPEIAQNDNRFSMRFVINSLKKKWTQVANVSTQTLYSWMTEEPDGNEKLRALTLIDARPEEEFLVSHIDGALRVDFDSTDVDSLISTIDQQDQAGLIPTVVCYCSLGYRSSKYADTIKKTLEKSASSGCAKAPHAEIYNLEGSIFKWANENRGHMVDGRNRPTVFVHPFSAVWGKVLFSHLRRSTMED